MMKRVNTLTATRYRIEKSRPTPEASMSATAVWPLSVLPTPVCCVSPMTADVSEVT